MFEPADRPAFDRNVVVPGVSARFFGGGLFVAGAIVFASLAGGQLPAPALRFTGVAIVALGCSVAIGLGVPARTQSPAWRDMLVAAGVLRSVPMPWFDRELSAGAREHLRRSLRRRPFALAAFIALSAVVLGALVGTRGLVSPMTGTAEIVLGERVDSVVLNAPTPGLVHPLGVTFEVVDVDAAAEVPSATLRLRRLSDGVVREHTLQCGQRAIVGGRGVSLVSLGTSGVAGRAVVVIDGTRMTLGTGSEVNTEAGVFAVTDMDLNRLGQLGPAVRIVERDADGEVLRDAWVYQDAADGFDARHGQRGGIEVLGVHASPIVTLRVTDSVVGARAVQMTVLSIGVLLIALLYLSARPVVVATGRDGDRTLLIYGWGLETDPVALHRDVIQWLDAKQLQDLEDLVAVAQEGR